MIVIIRSDAVLHGYGASTVWLPYMAPCGSGNALKVQVERYVLTRSWLVCMSICDDSKTCDFYVPGLDHHYAKSRVNLCL